MGEMICIKILVGNPQTMIPSGNRVRGTVVLYRVCTYRSWKDNSKMDHTGIGLESVHWFFSDTGWLVIRVGLL
jgi:hypothetical protein